MSKEEKSMDKEEKFLYIAGHCYETDNVDKSKQCHQFSQRFEQRQKALIEQAALNEKGRKNGRGRRKKSKRKWLVLASAAVLTAGMTVTSLASGAVGSIKSLLADDEIHPVEEKIVVNEFAEGGSETVIERNVENIAILQAPDSNEFKAAEEWKAYYWDDYFATEKSCEDSAYADAHGVPKELEPYIAYGAITEELAQKVDEIAEKYGLKRLTIPAYYETYEDMLENSGLKDFIVKDCHFELPYSTVYPEGMVSGDYTFDMKEIKEYNCSGQFSVYPKGVFAPSFINFGDLSESEEWAYTNESGNSVYLVLDHEYRRGKLLYSGSQSFVMFTASIPYENEAEGRERLESFADMLDVSQF